MKKKIHLTLDRALQGSLASAIENATKGSSEGTPKSVLQDLHKDE